MGRGDVYPYDRGPQTPYGVHRALTPKDTSHSAWDDVVETLGVPFDVDMAERGTSNGSGLPGTSIGWSSSPPRPWDRSDMDESQSDEAVPSMQLPGSHPLRTVEPTHVRKGVDLSVVIAAITRELVTPGSAWDELVPHHTRFTGGTGDNPNARQLMPGAKR